MSAPMKNVSEMSTTTEVKEEDFCLIEAKVATGFEFVAKEEALEKLNVEAVTATGRINIELPIKDVLRVFELEGIDNCYVLMTQVKDFPFIVDDELGSMKKLRNLVYEVNWELGLTVWKKFFTFKHPILAKPEVIPDSLGDPTPSSRIHKPQKGDNHGKRRKKKGQRSKNKAQNFNEGKSEVVSGDGTSIIGAEGSEIQTDSEKIEMKSETICEESNAENISEVSKTENADITAPTDFKNTSDVKLQNLREQDLEEGDEQKAKKQRVRMTEHDPLKPAFRVTCNRSGEHHSFDSMGAACNFGGAINDYFHWNVDMKNFDIEVVLNIDDNNVRVCLALTRESLHKRNLCAFGPTTLRPTISYNLLRLCKIKPGDVVCDPMCGSGSIPIQAAVSWPGSYHIAGELVHRGLKRVQENIENVNKIQCDKNKPPLKIDCIRWDVCNLPLKDECVDVFATDLPFGVRVGSKKDNWTLYPGAVQEMARVCKLNTGRACLLTQDKKCLNKSLQTFSRLWKLHKVVGINLGGLSVAAFVLHRTSLTLKQYLSEKSTPQQNSGKDL